MEESSLPVTPINVVFEPRLDKLSATFAAPPSLISSFEGLRTGTGASRSTGTCS